MIKNITHWQTTALSLVGTFLMLGQAFGFISPDMLGPLSESLNEVIASLFALALVFAKDPK